MALWLSHRVDTHLVAPTSSGERHGEFALRTGPCVPLCTPMSELSRDDGHDAWTMPAIIRAASLARDRRSVPYASSAAERYGGPQGPVVFGDSIALPAVLRTGRMTG